MLRSLVERLGLARTVALVTLTSCCLSFFLTQAAGRLLIGDLDPSIPWLGVVTAGLITPILAFPFARLSFQLIDLEQKNRILAAYDPVTGLMSRRALIAQAENYVGLAERGTTPLSLLFIDLDDFKEINDEYGHIAGDNVLHRVGQFINSLKRGSDIVGRYGGDEIIAVLPNTGQDGAANFTSRLHALLKENPVRINGKTAPLSLSIGVYTHQPEQPGIDIDEFIRRADLALYEAKARGKKRTVAYVDDNTFKEV